MVEGYCGTLKFKQRLPKDSYFTKTTKHMCTHTCSEWSLRIVKWSVSYVQKQVHLSRWDWECEESHTHSDWSWGWSAWLKLEKEVIGSRSHRKTHKFDMPALHLAMLSRSPYARKRFYLFVPILGLAGGHCREIFTAENGFKQAGTQSWSGSVFHTVR